MSESRIFEKVLFMRMGCRIPKGDIANVLNTYSTFIHPLKFVRTATGELNNVQKVWYAVSGCLLLTWKLFIDRKIEIVYIHSASDTGFWRENYAIKIAKMMGEKVVFYCHGGDFEEFRLSSIRKMNAVLAKVDCIVYLSGEWGDYFQSIGREHIMAIKNVIKEPNVENVKKNGIVHFLFLGLIRDDKSIFNVLKTVGDHKQKLQNRIILHIRRNGETDRLLSVIKELGAETLVRFEGWVDKGKKQYLLNLADAYILPSFIEDVPIFILEAEPYHKPVITTNVGGIPSITQDCVSGVSITPGNDKKIYLTIKVMTESGELRQKYGEVSYRISRDYQPEAIKKELTGCYDKALKTNNIK